MGWFFDDRDVGRKAFIKSLTDKSRFSEGFIHLEHRVVGNYVWHLILNESTGKKFIGLDMIAKERGGGWGYKSMDEYAGPVAENCPLTLLNKADPPDDVGYAEHWRERVRAYHARRKAVPKPVSGMVLKYGDEEYRLIFFSKSRKSWFVVRVSDEKEFMMTVRQVNQGLRNLVIR